MTGEGRNKKTLEGVKITQREGPKNNTRDSERQHKMMSVFSATV